MSESGQFRVEICSAQGHVSLDQLDQATSQLRDDLSSVNRIRVEAPLQRALPGTKAGDIGMLGQLLVTVLGPAGLAISLTSVLKDWLLRHRDFKLRLKRADGAELEISGVDPAKLDDVTTQINRWMTAKPDVAG